MKELNRVRRSSFGGSASSLARRSSISQKDIIALQETLQKQQKVSSQVVLLLFIIMPPATFFIFYSISIHDGLFMPTISSILFRRPFIFQCIPSLWDTVAWKFSIIHCGIQLLFYWFLPHDQALVMSSAGDQMRETNSFASCILTCLLYVLGASVGVYRGDLIYNHFNSIIAIFSLLSLIILAVLVISYHLGSGNNVTTVSELWFGIETHPKMLDIDLKSFIKTRFTMVIWPLYIISALYFHKLAYGKISATLQCLSFTQLFYIFHFHWSEDLYLNSLDSKRSSCGFYRLWADFVLAPVMYTAPVTVVAHFNFSTVGLISNCIFTIIAVVSIIFTAKCDRQKYDFRKSKGDLKMGGVDAFFISAKYKTDNGDTNVNLLLDSLLLGELDWLSSTNSSGTTGSDKTDLLSGTGVSSDGRRVSNMLVVTSSVWMFNWVHGNSSHAWPAVSLGLVLVVRSSGLEERLVGTSSSGDESDHGSVGGLDDLLGSRWETDTGLLGVRVVGDDGGVVSGSTSNDTTISGLVLDVADGGSFWEGSDRNDVSDLDLG